MGIYTDGVLQTERLEKDHITLCRHINNAFSTESGKVALKWLKEACYMATPLNVSEIESVAQNNRINARRDLFIVLEELKNKGDLHERHS